MPSIVEPEVVELSVVERACWWIEQIVSHLKFGYRARLPAYSQVLHPGSKLFKCWSSGHWCKMNVTTSGDQCSSQVSSYANLAVTGFTALCGLILVLLKKDGLLEHLLPKKQYSRKPTLRKVEQVIAKLGNLEIQIQNLTLQSSPDESSEHNNDRVHSPVRVRSDRSGRVHEDEKRVPFEASRRPKAQSIPALLAQLDWASEPRAVRPLPRRWGYPPDPTYQTDPRRSYYSSGSEQGTDSTSWDVESGNRSAVRPPSPSPPSATDRQPPSAP